MTAYTDIIDSPVGRLGLLADADGSLIAVEFDPRTPTRSTGAARCAAARRQLEEFFAGERRTFELELRPVGSPFQHRVWRALLEIPYGETRSYAWIAQRIGGSARAVGRANATNPIAIVVPCHRVIGADGSLTGYGGGLERKQWLLEFEGALAPRLL